MRGSLNQRIAVTGARIKDTGEEVYYIASYECDGLCTRAMRPIHPTRSVMSSTNCCCCGLSDELLAEGPWSALPLCPNTLSRRCVTLVTVWGMSWDHNLT
jgi:hypothetical protein